MRRVEYLEGTLNELEAITTPFEISVSFGRIRFVRLRNEQCRSPGGAPRPIRGPM
jgi:hypothetical protein